MTKLKSWEGYKLKLAKLVKKVSHSPIFLIKSNITPTEREITVKAEMANIIGGMICPNNHLSIKAIEYQGVIILLKVFLISD